MRSPSDHDLASNPLCGTIAIAEMTLIVLARSLRVTHPDIDRVSWPTEDPVVATARQIVDDCDALLYAIDHYRDLVEAKLHRRLCPSDYPF